MEILSLSSPNVALDSAMPRPAVEATAVAASLVMQKSLAWLLFAIGSLSNDVDLYLDPSGADKRFPFSELNRVKEPDAENKDASETEDDDEDDEDDEDGDEDDDDDEEEDDDDEGDSDDEMDAIGHGGDDDDEEDEEEEDEEDDEEDDDDDEEEDDEEDQSPPPSKKKK